MLGAEHVHLVNRWQRQMHGQPVIFQPRQYRIRSARLHCVVRGESADQPKAGAASQKVGAQSFRSRLHSNPAYQRFKERKGPPSQKQATAPTGDVKGPTSSSPATVLQSPSLQPEGTTLDPHSLLTQSKANSGTSHSAASQHSQSPGRNQSITFQPQNTPGKPRPFLQPLSAQTQSPYALAESQPSVPRHVDFAEGVQHKKTTARSSASAANFWLTFHAEFGQRLRIVGSHKNLGRLVLKL